MTIGALEPVRIRRVGSRTARHLVAACGVAAFVASGALAQTYARGREAAGGPPSLSEKWKGVAKKGEKKSDYNYFLPTGFTWTARLQNTIYSFAQQSPVILVVERDISYLGRIVIPVGTRVIGAALVEQNGDRILVQLGVLVFPTGDEIAFSGMALSLDGSVGLSGRVERRKDSQVANRVLRALVTGAQATVEATAASPVAAQMTQSIGQEAVQELDTERQRAVAVDKSITVDADISVSVYLNRRLEF